MYSAGWLGNKKFYVLKAYASLDDRNERRGEELLAFMRMISLMVGILSSEAKLPFYGIKVK